MLAPAHGAPIALSSLHCDCTLPADVVPACLTRWQMATPHNFFCHVAHAPTLPSRWTCGRWVCSATSFLLASRRLRPKATTKRTAVSPRSTSSSQSTCPRARKSSSAGYVCSVSPAIVMPRGCCKRVWLALPAARFVYLVIPLQSVLRLTP